MPTGPAFEKLRSKLSSDRLHTVCQAAQCPNIWECFSDDTATFLLLGDRCTRSCGFCAISHGPPLPPDPSEPGRVAEAAHKMGLDYVVLTSVTRDDLPDGGADHFAETIQIIRKTIPKVRVEVLIPDFLGDRDSLQTILDAHPNVLNHNIETVASLYDTVRPGASYERSLNLLDQAASMGCDVITKSGIMLGIGESDNQVLKTLEDLRSVKCSLLTLGQYLQPSKGHLPVRRFIPPEAFEMWRSTALELGFEQVASGPFVRSSYHAGAMQTAWVSQNDSFDN